MVVVVAILDQWDPEPGMLTTPQEGSLWSGIGRGSSDDEIAMAQSLEWRESRLGEPDVQRSESTAEGRFCSFCVPNR